MKKGLLFGVILIAGMIACFWMSLQGSLSTGKPDESTSSSPAAMASQDDKTDAPPLEIIKGRIDPASRKIVISDPALIPRLAGANNRFAFKLFSEMAKQEGGKNVFISPASIAFALAMACNGASGTTREAMEKALEYQGMNRLDINQANHALQFMPEGPGAKNELYFANSLWASKGAAFKPDFIQRNEEYYRAEIADLDFTDPKSLSTINQRVSEKTKGKISEIIRSEDLTRGTVLILLNALYFKGVWKERFDRAKTKEGIFTLPDGSQKKLPMMSRSGKYAFYRDMNCQAVSLPYSGDRLSLYLFLPNPDTSLAEFLKSLNAENWDQWVSRFQKRDGELMLPRFKLYASN